MDLKTALGGLAMVVTLLSQNVTSDPRDQADREVKRLPPSAFATILPGRVMKELEARGCTIPQTYVSTEPHNVIRGPFAKAGQFDWAVLCSVQRISSILVFWGRPARCASSLASGPDKYWLQDIGGGRAGYSRKLNVPTREYILSRNPEIRFPIDHDGIEDIFLEKASVVHYCRQGKWLRLLGAD